MTDLRGALLETVEAKKWFVVDGGWFGRNRLIAKAVDGVTVRVHATETLGIVGESGSGKTTLSRLMLRLQKPSSGKVLFRGSDIFNEDRAHLKLFRRSVQAVFQDPTSSLNPRMRVADIVGEPIRISERLNKSAVNARVREVLTEVGLEVTALDAYPHEFSGGQRQRIAVARALICNPTLVILDEPVSALDLSFKAQMLNLLQRLQEVRGMSYIFIAHDLAAVRYLCQQVAVMYLGEVVESGTAKEVFNRPMHPYTQSLLAATLTGRPRARPQRSTSIEDVPSPIAPPSGCKFRTRCPYAHARCVVERPLLQAHADGHPVACHLYSPETFSAAVNPMERAGETSGRLLPD